VAGALPAAAAVAAAAGAAEAAPPVAGAPVAPAPLLFASSDIMSVLATRIYAFLRAWIWCTRRLMGASHKTRLCYALGMVAAFDADGDTTALITVWV